MIRGYRGFKIDAKRGKTLLGANCVYYTVRRVGESPVWLNGCLDSPGATVWEVIGMLKRLIDKSLDEQ